MESKQFSHSGIHEICYGKGTYKVKSQRIITLGGKQQSQAGVLSWSVLFWCLLVFVFSILFLVRVLSLPHMFPQSLSSTVISSTPFTCVHCSSAALIQQSPSSVFKLWVSFTLCQILTVTLCFLVPCFYFGQSSQVFSAVWFGFPWLGFCISGFAASLFKNVSFLFFYFCALCLHLDPPCSPPSTRDKYKDKKMHSKIEIWFTLE